jgi:hypothetical protein
MRMRKDLELRSTVEPVWESYLIILYAASALIMVRSIFRVVEFGQGNAGYIISHEAFLYVFDGLLMVGVLVSLIVRHPSGLKVQGGARNKMQTEESSGEIETKSKQSSDNEV